jgi:hypothetical protein
MTQHEKEKNNAINTIQSLYPIDSEFSDTRATGQKLLLEAIEDTGMDINELPLVVLNRYAQLCRNEHGC